MYLALLPLFRKHPMFELIALFRKLLPPEMQYVCSEVVNSSRKALYLFSDPDNNEMGMAAHAKSLTRNCKPSFLSSSPFFPRWALRYELFNLSSLYLKIFAFELIPGYVLKLMGLVSSTRALFLANPLYLSVKTETAFPQVPKFPTLLS